LDNTNDTPDINFIVFWIAANFPSFTSEDIFQIIVDTLKLLTNHSKTAYNWQALPQLSGGPWKSDTHGLLDNFFSDMVTIGHINGAAGLPAASDLLA
jgi:hypothetical protein